VADTPHGPAPHAMRRCTGRYSTPTARHSTGLRQYASPTSGRSSWWRADGPCLWRVVYQGESGSSLQISGGGPCARLLRTVRRPAPLPGPPCARPAVGRRAHMSAITEASCVVCKAEIRISGLQYGRLARPVLAPLSLAAPPPPSARRFPADDHDPRSHRVAFVTGVRVRRLQCRRRPAGRPPRHMGRTEPGAGHR